ncbi:flagellar hook-basal body complex protein FliE [Bacillus sp. FJAT-50079]|uniref:flagellar hook-basal body complex protein FliE n=1 Tax=Bacillus sp. FJAT-50079 TaxID=2833577 RepID=UPI001BC9E681|nr:flagellar hook-basal body complex protein FliE [Bacillus sp. FJAT-50079]MBS4207628.1 flagellar hook-basal body complex protein FliE [Bacillus sp. FJAT-50079]
MNQLNLIQAVSSNQINSVQANMNRVEGEPKQNFATLLKSAINDVNEAQLQSDAATTKLAMGEQIELHDVMIAAQKATITLQAALEIRNKAVEAYQEIMRMQV